MKCRVCHNSNLNLIVDMGLMPLANDFSITGESKLYPLQLLYCDQCNLLQVSENIDPDHLFSNYPYRTSASIPLSNHFSNAAHDILNRTKDNDLVVEFGCNDGVMLECLKGKRRIVGIDPAQNLKSIVQQKQIPLKCKFFNVETASEIKYEYGFAKVIFAANVIAHVSDVHEIMKAVDYLLDPDGYLILEAHAVSNLLDYCCYDQIYHEHRCYFSLESIKYLLNMYDFDIVSFSTYQIHGVTNRIIAKKRSHSNLIVNIPKCHDNIKKIWNFSNEVMNHKEKFTNLILNYHGDNKKIAGYGAPAKGNILMNFLNLNNSIIQYITDTTKEKQGLKTPNTKIPIYDRDYYINNIPDIMVMFSWNYKDYIIQKEKHILNKGMKFIIPFPTIKSI